MSDTVRKNHPDVIYWITRDEAYWVEYGIKYPHRKAWADAQNAYWNRRTHLTHKGTDGHNAKGRSCWRFDSARIDGSGKLNTYTEYGAPRHANKRNKRSSSKDTRRYGREILRKELDE